MATVSGYVEKIKYRNEENGYSILSVNSDGLDYVLVAGQTAVDHGVHTHVRSGTVLGPEHRKGGN